MSAEECDITIMLKVYLDNEGNPNAKSITVDTTGLVDALDKDVREVLSNNAIKRLQPLASQLVEELKKAVNHD